MYWAEFFTVALVHLLAVASPGPDFAVVIRESIGSGRRQGLFCALGVALGIVLHVSYSLLGIGLIVAQSATLFTVFKFLAAGYLFYIGLKAICAQPAGLAGSPLHVVRSARRAFFAGLMTNGLNPKATLFFISLFTLVISPSTPLWVQAGYGAYLVVATGVWFAVVALLFSKDTVRQGFARLGHWFDRIMGVVLIGLAVELFFTHFAA